MVKRYELTTQEAYFASQGLTLVVREFEKDRDFWRTVPDIDPDRRRELLLDANRNLREARSALRKLTT